jgi:hypothetical protein
MYSRRSLLRLAVALPAAASIANFRALAQANAKKVKITAVKDHRRIKQCLRPMLGLKSFRTAAVEFAPQP